MKTATPKQISYAGAIAEELGIPLPEENTVEAYAEFIDGHVAEFKQIRTRRRYGSVYAEHMNNVSQALENKRRGR